MSIFNLRHPGRRHGTHSIHQPSKAEGEKKIPSVPSTPSENVVCCIFYNYSTHSISHFPYIWTQWLFFLPLLHFSSFTQPAIIRRVLPWEQDFFLLQASKNEPKLQLYPPAFLLPFQTFLLFLPNSFPPHLSGSLSLIHTGSRVIDLSARVRATASVTPGISSPVTRWWHRRCFHIHRFTPSHTSFGWLAFRRGTCMQVWNINMNDLIQYDVYSWLHSRFKGNTF